VRPEERKNRCSLCGIPVHMPCFTPCLTGSQAGGGTSYSGTLNWLQCYLAYVICGATTHGKLMKLFQ